MAATTTSSSSSLEDVEFIHRTSSGPPPASFTMVPALFTHPPIVRDRLRTDTSDLQDETVQACLPGLTADDESCNDWGVPHLDRPRHIAFLHRSLEPLPAPFLGYDASRPWLLFWCLNGLVLMGEDVRQYRDRVVATARTMQNPSGGFGGGHGQASHLATTYAVVLALAIVGAREESEGEGKLEKEDEEKVEKETETTTTHNNHNHNPNNNNNNNNNNPNNNVYDVIDRRALWRWLCRIKQPDGGFQMSEGGEEDVRGAYCASVIISLLGLPLDLTKESPAWTPTGTLFTGLADYVRRCQTYEGGIAAQPVSAEAHGGYAFCALGCLCLLGSPRQMLADHLDLPQLIAWLAARQYAPEGGFSGRTNKLVDGCYSHWVGDCWPIVEASLSTQTSQKSLFHREGLVRYVLCCCQDKSKRGGLRDKPGKMSDAYHTCYVLSGLSSAQHQWTLSKDDLSWTVAPFQDGRVQAYDDEDRVTPVHPVYTIPADRVRQVQEYFADRGF